MEKDYKIVEGLEYQVEIGVTELLNQGYRLAGSLQTTVITYDSGATERWCTQAMIKDRPHTVGEHIQEIENHYMHWSETNQENTAWDFKEYLVKMTGVQLG